MTRVYGIDLGTTYSCISVMDEGRARVLLNSEGKPTTPSVVFFESVDNVVVGENAKDVAVVYPDRVVSAVKRVMGDADFSFEVHGNKYSPQEISAFILRKLARDAKSITGEEVTDVVITVPAYFGVNEKAATRQAGEIAGLNVLKVVPEPTAAAIAYGMDQDQDQVVMVYDLGGGTFDVTVIEIRGDDITVVCTGGDPQLGGRNWDEAVAQHLASVFQDEKGIDADRLLQDPETYQELMAAGESCKEKLSNLTTVDQRVQFDADRVVCTLSRERFHEITGDLLERTIDLTNELYETSKEKGHAKIDKILLVGGSTYMPQVLERVERWCEQAGLAGTQVLRQDPNQIVACGASRFGFNLAASAAGDDELSDVGELYGVPDEGVKQAKGANIRNVTAKSFGVVVIDGSNQEKVCNLISVQDVLPKGRTHDFGVARNQQTGATIRCIENLEPVGPEVLFDFEDDWEIGRADLTFERPLPKGAPIEITFEMADDGQLVVNARDLTTNGKVQAVFQTDGVMSDDEVEEAKSRNMAVQLNG